MTGNGRHRGTAALPGSDWSRPASMDETGLQVTLYSETGSVEAQFDFSTLAGGIELRRAFAAAFDKQSGPNGPWRAKSTCVQGLSTVRSFLCHLSSLSDPPLTAEQISAAMVQRWQLSLPAGNPGRCKLLALRTLLPLVDGIPAETVAAVQRRIPHVQHSKQIAYSYEEFHGIRSRATKIFNTALTRLRSNREHLQRWQSNTFAPGSADWLIGEALDHVSRTGYLPRTRVPDGVYFTPRRYYNALGGKAPEQTWGRLFLTYTEINAAITLLVASEGWNRSVIDRMPIPGYDPSAGDTIDIYRVEINKPRRPMPSRYTTNNLLDSGADTPGRLIHHIIEATGTGRDTLRRLGTPTDRLLVWHCAGGRSPIRIGAPSICKIPNADGAPITVDLRRMRRTVQALIRKEPAQNSRHTHDTVYRLGDPATVADAKSTVAQGLNDAVEHAQIITRMRTLLDEDAQGLVELSDHPELASALARGDLDTATGACLDFTHSPFTTASQECTASFLLCLACPNAVATRRHLPRLIYLHKCLYDLRLIVSADVWEQDWHTHFQRLTALLMTNTTSAEQTAALAALSARDRDLIDRLLKRKLDP